MAVAAQNTNNTTIRSILLAEKLTSSNFTNWYRNLRIVLRYEKKIKFVEQPTGPALDPETANPNSIDKYYETINLEQEVACLMLSRGRSVSKLLSLKNEELLGHTGTQTSMICFAWSLILSSLNKDDDQFVQNYNMHNTGKRIVKLYDMLKLHKKAELKKRKNASITSTSGLRGSRKLKHGALSLYVGNGMRATVEAIGGLDLVLPSGLIIVLHKCHFAPTITWGIVSISRLVNNGYIHTFTNYGIYVSKDNVFYFNVIPRDGIYEIDMHNLYPNVSSMFNVSNKRAKHSLDSSYLWHCRLSHINKKRMDKLHNVRVAKTSQEVLQFPRQCT
ncbi:zinc finger, CCHC-type containing protein [Tanacetum coccineum]